MNITAGRALADRAQMEEEFFSRFYDAYLTVARVLVDMALKALDSPVLVASAEPLSYTRIWANWRQAIDTMASKREDLYMDEVLGLMRESQIPGQMGEAVYKVLIESQDGDWTKYKTKRELSKIIMPKRREGEDPAGFRAKVRNMASTAATWSLNSKIYERMAKGGVNKKQWVAHHDNKTRPSHAAASGQVVGLLENFEVGDEFLFMPGYIHGSPKETYNCRCVMIPYEEEEIDYDAMRTEYEEWHYVEHLERLARARECDGDLLSAIGTECMELLAWLIYIGESRHFQEMGGYLELNYALRNRSLTSAEQSFQMAMDRAFTQLGSTLPKDMTLMRGFGASDKFDPRQMQAGTILEDPGYLSTTVDDYTRSQFMRHGGGDPWQMDIKVKKGQTYLAGNDFEYELILPAGTRMRVQEIDYDNNILTVEVI